MKREGFGDRQPRNILKTASHWRMRAEEARTIADGVSDPTVTAIILRIAASYDRMAVHADESAALEARLGAATSPPCTIRRMSEGAIFDHKATAILSRAFEAVVAELDLRTVDERERAARAIIELANARPTIDVEKLCNAVVRLLRQKT